MQLRGVSNVTNNEIHTAEALVSESNAFEVEMDTKKLKKNTNNQVLMKFQQNFFKQEVGQFLHKLISSIWNGEELLQK